MSRITEAAAISDQAFLEAEHTLSVLRSFSIAVRSTTATPRELDRLCAQIASAKRSANLCKQLCDQVELKLTGDRR